MKILNIIQCTNLGGTEQATLVLLRELISRGHKVELISLNPLGELQSSLVHEGIPSIGLEYRGFGGWRSLWAMLSAFKRSRHDAILLSGHNLAATLALLFVPAKKKILAIHFHHFEDNKSIFRWLVFYRVANIVFDQIAFCTDFIRLEALKIYPQLRGKALLVPYAFPIPEMPSAADRDAARRLMGIDADALVVGNAGWLIPRKRFDIFLKVASRVSRDLPEAVFVIGGDGPERSSLEGRAKELNLGHRVHFLGWTSDMPSFYKALDVLLFNSDFDALGRTPSEAASYGVPVVASVVRGGLNELFRSKNEAIVLEKHDVDCLAETVIKLGKNETCRRKLGAAGRARVADYGSLAKHVDQFERMLSGQS